MSHPIAQHFCLVIVANLITLDSFDSKVDMLSGELSAFLLPASETVKADPACNPGMYKNEKGECKFCPADEYSDGTKACQKCPAKHRPDWIYDFEYWDSLPPNTEAYCFSYSEQGCRPEGTGWTLSNDAISSNLGNADDTIVIIDIFVPGFTHMNKYAEGRIQPVGIVEFVFEMKCDPEEPKCVTVFAEATEVDFEVINYWEGDHDRSVYRYPVAINSSKTFTWAFQKSAEPEQEIPSHMYRKAQLRIHSITINGTMVGGAKECKPCVGYGAHCQQCQDGYFYSQDQDICVACPNELEHDLTSYDGQRCHSECKVSLEDDRMVDLSRLNAIELSVRTQPAFSHSRFVSYELYKFSLCGNPDTGSGLATCHTSLSRIAAPGESNQMDAEKQAEIQQVIEQSTRTGFVCRSDLLLSFGDSMDYFTERPTVLREELIAVTSNRTYIDWSVKTIEANKITFGVNLYYISLQPTHACPNGHSVIVTLRCDPSTSESDDKAVILDSGTPEATFDGCEYNFLMASKYVCPATPPKTSMKS